MADAALASLSVRDRYGKHQQIRLLSHNTCKAFLRAQGGHPLVAYF